MEIRRRMEAHRPLRDAPADRHHCLGFCWPATRGLRCVAVRRARRVAPAGRRARGFKCGPRDRWSGWKPEQRFERLDPVANNTRFLVLSELRALPRLASFFLAAMNRRPGPARTLHARAAGRGRVLGMRDCHPEGLREGRPEPTDLGTAMPVPAMLGGCLNRKRDGLPSKKTVRTGCMRLATAAQA